VQHLLGAFFLAPKRTAADQRQDTTIGESHLLPCVLIIPTGDQQLKDDIFLTCLSIAHREIRPTNGCWRRKAILTERTELDTFMNLPELRWGFLLGVSLGTGNPECWL
jgi:hypothetical protein